MNDISLHVLDLVQNSLAADASDIFITVGTRQNKFWLVIRDNGKGLPRSACASAHDPFYTTRTTRKVGLGLALIDQIAKLCEGHLLIRPLKPGLVVHFTAQAGHWDLPPLGNMRDTLLTLIYGNPQCRFRYCHLLDAGLKLFDSSLLGNRRLRVVRSELDKFFESQGGLKLHETG